MNGADFPRLWPGRSQAGEPTPRFLASVRNAREALLARDGGAEIIDCKEPAGGALGAVAPGELTRLLAALGPDRPLVSATIGDLPWDPAALAHAIERTAARGVDIVKFGVFAAGAAARTGLAELGAVLARSGHRVPLVALLLAERLRDLDEAADLAAAALQVGGVRGIMIDTETKGGAPGLIEIFSPGALSLWVQRVHASGAWAGLAGSLRIGHIEALAGTGADVLGFRGALCGGKRTDDLCPAAARLVRDQVLAARARRKACGSASETTQVAIAGRAAAHSA